MIPPPTTLQRGYRRAPLALFLFAALLVLGPLVNAASSPSPKEPLGIDEIVQQLNARVQEVRDITATINFLHVAGKDGSTTEGAIRLEAILPNLIRATWLGPELWEGTLFIVDVENNTFLQYLPTTGEADSMPLDAILEDLGSQNALIPIAPEELFSLPSADEFTLVLERTFVERGTEYAIVHAASKTNGSRFRVWVDTTNWFIVRTESLNANGQVEDFVEAKDVAVNQGLLEASMRRLPPGAVVRFIK